MLSYKNRDYYSVFTPHFGPYTCKLCGREVTHNSGLGASLDCPTCLPRYERFKKDNPGYGQNLTIGGMTLSFDEWLEAKWLEQMRDSGEITPAEAREEAKNLATIIKEHYQPQSSKTYRPKPPQRETLDIFDNV